jgi:Zn-dependent protease
VEVHAQPAQVPVIVVLGLVVVFIHELGHALVTIHYGRHVRAAGLRLHLGAPAFYVESLDALLLTRRQRLLQAAAGPWAEWLATSVVALFFLSLGPDSDVAAILHRFVAINTFVIANNLLPFAGLDGAYLFADAVRRPDLPFRTATAFSRSASGERWIVVYSGLNALVAAGLFIVAGYFWWQLFGGVFTTLWAGGPVGIAIVTTLCVLLCRHLSGTFSEIFATARAHAGVIWSKIVFRLERRWRVEAVNAFRSLPELAELSADDLGIIAGRLQRCCGRDVAMPLGSSHLYVRSGPPLQDPTGPTTKQRRVIALNQLPRFTLTDQHDVVALPTGWRAYLNSSGC